MLTIPTAALLQAWERGHDASPGQRGLILLALAHPDVPRAALEMDIPVATISMPAPTLTSNRFMLAHAGYRLTYRLPTAGDLAALADAVAPAGDEVTRDWLLRRCVLDMAEGEDAGSRDGGAEPDGPVGLPPERNIPGEVIGALEASIASTVSSLDPLAEIELTLDCPECGFSWRSPFDIVSFLWSELDAWARQMLREIHVLASHYGWSEADIIALSAQRRQHYRGLIGI